MFIGMPKAVGTIQEVQQNGTVRIAITSTTIIDHIHSGSQVSVDGIAACIENYSSDSYIICLHSDTFFSSAFRYKNAGDRVHLETALRLGEQIEGLMVSGVLDGLATVIKIRRIGEKLIFSFRPEQELMKYMSVRGSVVVNGMELSIFARSKDNFTCAVYRYMREKSYFDDLQEGDYVNLEISSVARYLENLMEKSNFFHKRHQA